MRIFSKTDKGKVRTDNQDAYFAGSIADNAAFAVVCDGMGGANAGNVASENAVRHISEYIIRSYRDSMDAVELEKTLRNAVASANIELFDMSASEQGLSGMGTTAVIALIKDGEAVIANVGDSRIYLVNEEIKQLTRDHSVVQSLIESGKIPPEDAKFHPRKNVITRAIGAEGTVTADSDIIKLNSGDTLLLCTDGLSNYLDDNEILSVFKNTDISSVPEMLVLKANQNGGGDNITVVTLSQSI